jgi:endonuclease/exonuclease/phosphatase family metal-dependent hydrolase
VPAVRTLPPDDARGEVGAACRALSVLSHPDFLGPPIVPDPALTGRGAHRYRDSMFPPRRLRIATLNCLNLALPGLRFYEGWEPYTGDEYLAKTQWLANLLDRLAADFVLVQEVFHEQALADVVRQTAGSHRGHALAVPLADEANTRPRLGLIWRTPWQPRLETIADFPAGTAVAVPEREPHARFSRPLLLARVPWGAADGPTLALLNVHLKSRRPEFVGGEAAEDPAAEARAQLRSLVMRGAEAAALRRLVIELTRTAGAPLVVAGDFNDAADAVTTQIVADTSWQRPEQPQREHRLFDALDVVERPGAARGRAVAYTVLHAGEPERIDHVFVSEEFVADSGSALARVLAVEIYNDHLTERLAHERGFIAGADPGRIYSDHAAVCVTVELIDRP